MALSLFMVIQDRNHSRIQAMSSKLIAIQLEHGLSMQCVGTNKFEYVALYMLSTKLC